MFKLININRLSSKNYSIQNYMYTYPYKLVSTHPLLQVPALSNIPNILNNKIITFIYKLFSIAPKAVKCYTLKWVLLYLKQTIFFQDDLDYALYQTKKHKIPEYCHLYICCHENMKSHLILFHTDFSEAYWQS